ncbi:sensor histidine kinase [Paenibacillus sp. WST5]|uniref:histidine kinase n=1 Tax=Paenibacillus sedimenti TaxID=2770274 RepID=A0A926KSG1_9BACL|nr:sensor histidine kinase [Paenibacillus sedimenti]
MFFNRFQIRLLLYLLIIGSLPLLASIYIFYEQLSAYGNKELTYYVEQAHEQANARVNQELQFVSEIAHRSAADYAVQHYSKMPDLPSVSKEVQDLRNYINNLLSEQTIRNPYVEQICFSMKITSRTLCSQNGDRPEAMDTRVQGAFKSFEPVFVDKGNLSGYVLAYTAPIADIQTSQELGTVTVWVNMSKLWKHATSNKRITAFMLVDQQNRILYRFGANDDETIQNLSNHLSDYMHTVGETIFSVKHFEVPGGQWASYYEVPNSLSSNPHLRSWLILLFGLVAVLSVGASLLFTRYVRRPLHLLKALMNRAERGDLRAYWTSKSPDDWNELGQSYNQMLNRLEDLIKQVKLEESLKKEAEMEALHYQLNPHFLYNTLNTIKWVAKIHKTPQISEVVSALVRLLQASLGKKGEFITLREESGLILDYMEIQKFRYGDRVQVIMKMDETTLGCLVPRMLLQPLVENAIIHGIEPAKREGSITIRSWLDRDLLFCQVEDNGVGMPVEDGGSVWPGVVAGGQASRMIRERMSGIGLAHIREKIKLYYGNGYKMHIGSKPGEGTSIRISLPIHQSEE